MNWLIKASRVICLFREPTKKANVFEVINRSNKFPLSFLCYYCLLPLFTTQSPTLPKNYELCKSTPRKFFFLCRIKASKPEQAGRAQIISVLPLLPWRYWSGELLLIFVAVIIYFSNHFSSVTILSLLSLTSHCID